MPKWQKLASLAQEICTLVQNSSFSSLVQSLLPKDTLLKNAFDFTTAGDWDCVATVERLPALH